MSRAPLILGPALVAVVMLVPVVPAAYSAYDDAPEAFGLLADSLAARGYSTASVAATTLTLDRLADAEDTAFVTARQQPYGPAEVHAVERFLDRGGTVVVAAPAIGLEELLLAASIRILANPVVSETHGTSPEYPVLGGNLTGRAFTLLSHLPAPLRTLPGFDGEVLARAADRSYLLSEQDVVRAEDESSAFPIIVHAALGRGQIVVMGDPDIFSNRLLGNSSFDNGEFSGAVFDRLIGPGGVVLFDETEAASTAAEVTTQAGVLLAYTVGAYSLAGGLAAAVVLVPLARRYAEVAVDESDTRPGVRVRPRTESTVEEGESE